MPKYWGKQIVSLGRFPEVGQKQKTEKKKRDWTMVITMAGYALKTPPRVAHAKPPGSISPPNAPDSVCRWLLSRKLVGFHSFWTVLTSWFWHFNFSLKEISGWKNCDNFSDLKQSLTRFDRQSSNALPGCEFQMEISQLWTSTKQPEQSMREIIQNIQNLCLNSIRNCFKWVQSRSHVQQGKSVRSRVQLAIIIVNYVST